MLQTIYFIVVIVWAIAGILVYEDNLIHHLRIKRIIESIFITGPFVLIIISVCGFWLTPVAIR